MVKLGCAAAGRRPVGIVFPAGIASVAWCCLFVATLVPGSPSLAGPAGVARGALGSGIVARSALVLDVQDGTTLFAKDADRRMHPASTTKVLTAMLAIESDRLDDWVVIQESDTKVVPSILGLVPGERIVLRDLVYGLLLQSGNDAARAIARHLAGTQEAFAQQMNLRARQLGCTSSHFVNPHGLTHRRHYTTARDLGRIMRHAMGLPEFRAVTATQSYRSQSSLRTRTFHNKNKLLHLYDGANGGKPGYTRAAQQTLVASAARQGHEVVVVCLHSVGKSLWSDATRLLDFGFRRLERSASR